MNTSFHKRIKELYTKGRFGLSSADSEARFIYFRMHSGRLSHSKAERIEFNYLSVLQFEMKLPKSSIMIDCAFAIVSSVQRLQLPAELGSIIGDVLHSFDVVTAILIQFRSVSLSLSVNSKRVLGCCTNIVDDSQHFGHGFRRLPGFFGGPRKRKGSASTSRLSNRDVVSEDYDYVPLNFYGYNRISCAPERVPRIEL